LVNRIKPEPSALQAYTSGLPPLLRIIATLPLVETAAAVFKPE
jgi:hypothetical protein